MWKINQGYADKVKEVLNELGGICPRCLLRCSGVKNSAIMRDAEKPSTHDENAGKETFDEPPPKKSKILPCRLCLGLLEERYMESALKSVRIFQLHTLMSYNFRWFNTYLKFIHL